MEKFTLTRTKQCAKCPWKKSTNPHDIPNGYCETKHKALDKTIAKNFNGFSQTLYAMACHESEKGEEEYCIGWLANQLGEGNNIGLRIKMLNCSNVKDIELVGKQHKTFKDTLPKGKELSYEK